MVSAVDSSSYGLGSNQGTALCSCARHFTLIVPLSTQVYKRVPATCNPETPSLNPSPCRWMNLSLVVPNSTPPRFVNSQLVSLCQLA